MRMMSSPEGPRSALDHGGIDVYTIAGSMSKRGVGLDSWRHFPAVGLELLRCPSGLAEGHE